MYGNPVSRAQTMALLADTARHRGRHPRWWLPALLCAIAACRPDAVPEDSAGMDASSAPAIVSAVPASPTLLERVELTPLDASGIAGEVVVLATRVATRLDLDQRCE
jgi:hypothetical protein